MKALRTALSFCSLIASMLLGLLALIYLTGGLSLVPQTIENGKTIDRDFHYAATWVDGFAKKNGHLPNQGELATWAELQSQQHNWVTNMWLLTSTNELPEEAMKVFGQIPHEGYVLGTWRGEWSEYYCSWKQTSTVDSPIGLWTSTFIVSLMLLLGGMTFWDLWQRSRPTRRSSGAPKASFSSSAEL